jgi:hypothetical protein
MKDRYAWKDEYARKFAHIKKSSKGPQYANCSLCPLDIKIASIGISAIVSHQKSEKHKENVKVKR